MSDININDFINGYTFQRHIGNGSFGSVHLVKKDDQLYVLKKIPILQTSSKEEIIQIKNEAKYLASINSDYIVKYYDSFEKNNMLYIIMEYCEGGDLDKYLHKNNKILLNEDIVWKFFIQISLGVYVLHKKKILHRDLKTLNIFLSKNNDAKIGDLGVAKSLMNTNFACTFIGTPYYLSPEICEEKPYNEKSDVWALGCILYEMATFKHPFNAKSQAALFFKILGGKYEPLPNKVSNDIKTMIKLLLEKNCYKRPYMFQIIESKIFLQKAKKLNMLQNVIDTYENGILYYY